MSPLVQTMLVAAVVTLGAMIVLWLMAVARSDVSLIDVYWGTGFAATAWIAIGLNRPVPERVWLLAALTTVWGLRLSAHLCLRNWGHEEDRRYAAMRRRHGRRFWWISLFTVFLLQGVILWFVALPLQVAAANRSFVPWGLFDVLGAALWTIGFFFEAVGDRQLARFRADPCNRGRVLDRGLWQYTRHPNYFGDFCVWWGLYLIAAAGGAGWTVGSPLLMSFLLLRVSGVTLLEQAIDDRRPDYVRYRENTNAFFPWPRKIARRSRP